LRGSVQLNEHLLATSDGAAISDTSSLSLIALNNAEIMLFDLA
jgi:redox-sensitive bicupin YhaK (pirin superfamily)